MRRNRVLSWCLRQWAFLCAAALVLCLEFRFGAKSLPRAALWFAACGCVILFFRWNIGAGSGRARRLRELDALEDGYAFELFVAETLRRNGFVNVELTRKTRDFGADVLAERDGCRYAVQCKLYSAPVGNAAVGEVLAGMKYYDCEYGIVATNATFTAAARALAERSEVLLWDREDLLG